MGVIMKSLWMLYHTLAALQPLFAKCTKKRSRIPRVKAVLRMDILHQVTGLLVTD